MSATLFSVATSILIHLQSLRKFNYALNLFCQTILLLVMLGLIFFTGSCRAEFWQQTASVHAATEYESNPAMIPAYQEKGIWRSTVDPSYRLLTADNSLQAGLALHVARNSNKRLQQDRNDPSVFVNWIKQLETGELGIRASYVEAATRTTELDAVGPVNTNGTSTSRSLTANWKKLMGERSSLDLNGSYRSTNFKGAALVGFVTQSGGVDYSYIWSEIITPFINLSYIDFASTGSISANGLYRTMLGFNWKTSDRLDGTIQAGQFHRKNSASKDNSQGSVILRYAGENSRLVFNVDRSAGASGLGGFVITDQASFHWSYDLSEPTTSGLDFGWRKSQFVNDNYLRTAGAWLQSKLSSFWASRLYYQGRISSRDGISDATSNTLGLSFTYTNPNF